MRRECIMSGKNFNLISRRIATAYIQYKDHPCIANQTALISSLEALINNNEDLENSGNQNLLDQYLHF